MINTLLNHLGFSDKEAKIYLAILREGRTSPAKIAELTRINRTTVYSVTKQLIGRGVITEDLGSTPAQLVALPPAELGSLIEREERRLVEKRDLVDMAVRQLEPIAKLAQYSVPHIEFVDEERIESYLYRQAPEWNRSVMDADGIWWGFQAPAFVEDYHGWIDWFWQHPDYRPVSARLLTTESKIEETMAQRGYRRRKMKYWKGAAAFTATTWVCGDYLIMIATSHRPYFLVDFHDRLLAENMRELFKGIWDAV